MTIYLYKKTHNKTGIKYLGKTVSNPHKYRGSGKYRKLHIKKHGNDVTTEILRECQTKEELKEWGLYYSKLWNVVESKEWANLQPEEGQGFASGEHHHSKKIGYINPAKTEENRRSAGDRMKALGDKHWAKTEEFKANMSGDRNPANSSRHKTRMVEQNPRLLPHNQERWRQIFLEDNPMTKAEVVKKITGKNHYLYDSTIHTWKNINTEEIVTMTRGELAKSYDINPGDVGRVILGHRNHAKGWSLDD